MTIYKNISKFVNIALIYRPYSTLTVNFLYVSVKKLMKLVDSINYLVANPYSNTLLQQTHTPAPPIYIYMYPPIYIYYIHINIIYY